MWSGLREFEDGPQEEAWVPLDVVAGEESPVGVGGIAELPELAGPLLGTPHSSGRSVGVLGSVAAAAALGTVTLGGAAWYARRRRRLR